MSDLNVKDKLVMSVHHLANSVAGVDSILCELGEKGDAGDEMQSECTLADLVGRVESLAGKLYRKIGLVTNLIAGSQPDFGDDVFHDFLLPPPATVPPPKTRKR